jgi:hypothetical protein
MIILKHGSVIPLFNPSHIILGINFKPDIQDHLQVWDLAFSFLSFSFLIHKMRKLKFQKAAWSLEFTSVM